MADAGTIKYGGWAFVLSAVFYFATFVFNTFTDSAIGYGLAGLVGTVLVFPAGWGLCLYYQQHDDSYRVRLATVALLVGAAFISALYIVALAGALSDIDIEGTVIDAFGQGVAQVGIMFGNITFIGTFLFALSGLQSGSDPKWLAWVGLVGSVVTVPWFAIAFVPPILQIIPAFGFLLVIIWMVGIGVRMARHA